MFFKSCFEAFAPTNTLTLSPLGTTLSFAGVPLPIDSSGDIEDFSLYIPLISVALPVTSDAFVLLTHISGDMNKKYSLAF